MRASAGGVVVAVDKFESGAAVEVEGDAAAAAVGGISGSQDGRPVQHAQAQGSRPD